MLDKAKCFLEGHSVKLVWDVPNSCTATEVCTRCGRKVYSGDKHEEFGEWEDEPTNAPYERGPCFQQKVCLRCGVAQKRGGHQWAKRQEQEVWEYEHANSCSKVATCLRCTVNSRPRLVHVWDAGEYKAPNDCWTLLTCLRCGHKETRLMHPLAEREQLSRRSSICRRCGMEDTYGDGDDDGWGGYAGHVDSTLHG